MFLSLSLFGNVGVCDQDVLRLSAIVSRESPVSFDRNGSFIFGKASNFSLPLILNFQGCIRPFSLLVISAVGNVKNVLSDDLLSRPAKYLLSSLVPVGYLVFEIANENSILCFVQ